MFIFWHYLSYVCEYICIIPENLTYKLTFPLKVFPITSNILFMYGLVFI